MLSFSMIFDNIEQFANLTLSQIQKHFGTFKKDSTKLVKHRSNMMLNPLNLKHLNSLDESIADVVTLNLEDAIAPSRKKEALYNIALFLSHIKNSKSFIVVRTNPLDESGKEEIEFLNDFGLDAIRLPKVKTPKELELALKILNKDYELHFSMETKEAFANIKEFKIDKCITTSNLGILDLLASLKLPQSIVQIGNPTIDYILSKFLIDCKIANIHPVSFMYQDYNNTDEFRKWCKYEKSLGFDSKACMGPKQAIIANEIFDIDSSELEKAKYIKELFEANSSKGINGFMDDKYGFIDEPIYRDALNILT
ncbi:MAG: aldolase/citrate lyase family protein [Sulfurovaceae bacterium]|nr:aldolase/citrate lyase family protein [Sulfurovaceae bacterium]